MCAVLLEIIPSLPQPIANGQYCSYLDKYVMHHERAKWTKEQNQICSAHVQHFEHNTFELAKKKEPTNYPIFRKLTHDSKLSYIAITVTMSHFTLYIMTVSDWHCLAI